MTLWRMLRKKDAFYFPRIDWIQELMNSGILAGQDARNPFNDWNFILLPYTTGDFHAVNKGNFYNVGLELLEGRP